MEDRKVVLKADNIIKKFQGTVALKGVTVELYENEILAIMGENGAGKTTLMKILSGLYPRNEYEGKIILDNEECQFMKPSDSEKHGIAMIYQEISVELDLSVAENVMLGILPKNKIGLIDWKKCKEKAQNALEILGVNIDVNVNLRSLSPSMQQLVCIARSIVRNPKMLILDEPTSVLTENETKKLMVILKKLKSSGISCIYISHKLDEVFEISDRMIILRDGNYISEYKKENGYDSKLVIRDMIGRNLEVMFPQSTIEIGDEVLRVENICVPHPFAIGKNILEDVSFILRKGEILGLCGLVGSGRSELVNSIFGVTPKKSGNIFVNGKKVEIETPQDAKRHGIGLLTEDRKKNGFVASMTIMHNMTLTVLRNLRKKIFLDEEKEKKLSKKYFDILRIKAPSLNTLISSLSGGNQQKVILAKWLMTDLKILFLDEPTRGIDVGTKVEIYKIMQDLASKGVSIIMISSELPELIANCNRFLVLGKGKVQKMLEKKDADEVSILKASSNM